MEWTDESVFIFVNEIQSHPCLWNPRDSNKKNRKKVHDAFQSIAKEMGLNIEDVKKKKETLFQTYRNCRRKVACSQKAGAGTEDLYTPSWAPYSLLDAFLHGVYTPKGNFDLFDNLEDSVTEAENDSRETPDPNMSENETGITEDKFHEDLQTKSPTKINLKRPRNEHYRGKVAFAEFMPFSDHTATRNTSSEVTRDECSVFGELLAIKLRKLDDRTQQLAMHKIDNIMFELTFNSPQ